MLGFRMNSHVWGYCLEHELITTVSYHIQAIVMNVWVYYFPTGEERRMLSVTF